MHGAAILTNSTGWTLPLASRGSGETSLVFEIHDLPDGFTVDGARRLEDKVIDVIVGLRCPVHHGPDTEPLQTKIRT